jgi:hypothetical protein
LNFAVIPAPRRAESPATRAILTCCRRLKSGKRQQRRSAENRIAAELRNQTALSMGWIAKELNAGAPNSVWNAVRWLQVRGDVGRRE